MDITIIAEYDRSLGMMPFTADKPNWYVPKEMHFLRATDIAGLPPLPPRPGDQKKRSFLRTVWTG